MKDQIKEALAWALIIAAFGMSLWSLIPDAEPAEPGVLVYPYQGQDYIVAYGSNGVAIVPHWPVEVEVMEP